MQRLTLLLALVLASSLAFPSAALAGDTTNDPPGGIMRSGIAAVQRMSETSDTEAMAQVQQTKLKKFNRTAKIVVIGAAAVAAVVWIRHELRKGIV